MSLKPFHAVAWRSRPWLWRSRWDNTVLPPLVAHSTSHGGAGRFPTLWEGWGNAVPVGMSDAGCGFCCAGCCCGCDVAMSLRALPSQDLQWALAGPASLRSALALSWTRPPGRGGRACDHRRAVIVAHLVAKFYGASGHSTVT
jgi:hypothetical protein